MSETQHARSARRVAVIGGGVAGCAAAYVLRKHGRDVVLFEKEKQVGGRTHTWHAGGRVVDSGAAFFASFYRNIWRYIPELGLQTEVVRIPRRSLFVRGDKTGTFQVGSARSFLAFPFLTWPEKVRFALGAIRLSRRHRRLDLSDPATLSAADGKSVGQEALLRFGERTYHYFIRPMIEPFWYFSCEEASRALFFSLLAHGADASFFGLRKGMDRLCEALAAQVETFLGVAIQSLEKNDRGQVSLLWQDGVETFDQVVIATTASAALGLIAGVSERWVSEDQRTFLAGQRYEPNVHVVFALPSGAIPKEVFTVIPCGPGTNPVAILSVNRHMGKDEIEVPGDLISVYASRLASREMLSASNEEQVKRCWQAARELWPALPGGAASFRVATRGEAIPIHAAGRYRLAEAFHEEQRPPILFAGDYLATATVDGALASGERAAHRLLREDPL